MGSRALEGTRAAGLAYRPAGSAGDPGLVEQHSGRPLSDRLVGECVPCASCPTGSVRSSSWWSCAASCSATSPTRTATRPRR